MENLPIHAEIFRYWPEVDDEPSLKLYEVPYEKGLTVMGLIRCVYRTMDRTLAFRDFQCGVGACGTCRLNINGKNQKACVTLLAPGEHVRVEPLKRDRVLRDLACKT